MTVTTRGSACSKTSLVHLGWIVSALSLPSLLEWEDAEGNMPVGSLDLFTVYCDGYSLVGLRCDLRCKGNVKLVVKDHLYSRRVRERSGVL